MIGCRRPLRLPAVRGSEWAAGVPYWHTVIAASPINQQVSVARMSSDRALWKSLASRSFVRAYCFHGEEDFLKDEAVRQLLAAALDPATRDFNLDVRDAASLDAETLGSLLATPPMMADRRVIVVRDAAALRKDARAAVGEFLAQPTAAGSAPDVILVLVYAAGEKGKPDRAIAERAYTVDMEPLSGDRVPRWITHHARTVLGVEVTSGAAALLLESVGSDLGALTSELDKLASFTAGGPIDEAAVTAVVGVRRGETLGDLLDAIAHCDARRALGLLEHVLEQPKTGAVPIVMAATTQTLALAWGRARRDQGVPASRLEREYFDFLKGAGGAYTGRPWGEAVRAWAAAVDAWDQPAVDRALAALLAADMALKETRVSSDEEILARLVLAVCAGGGAGRRRAAVA